jgi:hypothetical protein
MHHQLSTSPSSGFVRVATIMRRVEGGVEILRGCEHSLLTAAGTTSSEVASEGDWWGTVIDGFGLAYGDVPSNEQTRIWAKVREAHEAWLAAGRS